MKRKMKFQPGHTATLACMCFFLHACITAYAEHKSVEVDGVVYSYVIDGCEANGNKRVILGRYGKCAVEIPDDRTRLEIPKVIMGERIERIDDTACRHLVDVEEIVLPDGITEIGPDAFSECWSLKKINIPASVHTIGSRAFEDCEKLKAIILPEDVTIVGNEVFKGCKSLESFEFPKGVCTWKSCPVNLAREEIRRRQNHSAHSTGQRGRDAGCRGNDTTVHSRQDGLGDEFFAGCSSLTKIALPSSFNRIGYQAFYGCVNLTVIDLPPNLTKIGIGAFRGCKSLESIDLPESVVEIGYNAFNGCCRLKTIELPYRITEIDAGTFGNCTSLKAISIPENVKANWHVCLSRLYFPAKGLVLF